MFLMETHVPHIGHSGAVTVTDAALIPPELLAGISGEGPMNLPI